MSLLEELNAHIGPMPSGLPLASGVQLEWHRDVDSIRDSAVLIIVTERKLTLDGGDGYSGVDGSAMNRIHDAVEALANEHGMIRKFIVRQR